MKDLSAGNLELTDLEERRRAAGQIRYILYIVCKGRGGERDTALVVHCLVGFLPGDVSEVQIQDAEASDDGPGTGWIAKSGLVVPMEVSP